MEDPTLEQVEAPEGGCDPMGSPCWSKFLAGPVDPWREEPTPEQKFVRSAPSSYANSLTVIDWKSEEAPAVDEVAGQLWEYEESLSSSLVSAVEKLSQEVRQLKEDIIES
ncbi:EH domain-containing protein 4 [Grus japonensis]|uniref:EH domain-containing protein 4 n=1 Tax=Grus japonensis TaxID=30415 RepID=A0ABC9YG24_GRUJA